MQPTDKDSTESFRQEARCAIDRLAHLLQQVNPLEVISRAAIHILSSNPDVQEPERPDQNETHLEYLISLVAAQPFPESAPDPTPNEIRQTIDLLTEIHTLTSVHYISQSTKMPSPLDNIAASFRTDRLHVRGDAYWSHFRKTMGDMLSPHDSKFQELLGFTSKIFFEFMERAEIALQQRVDKQRKTHIEPLDRLMMPWVIYLDANGEPIDPEKAGDFDVFLKQKAEALSVAYQNFDAFGTPDLFVIAPENEAEEMILRALSCTLGENTAFHGSRSDDRFWPLTSSVTEQRPIIHHNGTYYAFHLPAILRGTYDLISHLLKSSDPDYWKHNFLRSRDGYLEQETARLLRKALPHGKVFEEFTYSVSDQSSEPDVDVIAICDDFLLVVECKAGRLRASARRGASLSVKSGIKDTIGKAHSQGTRLINELVEHGSLTLRSKDGDSQFALRLEDFRHVISVSVTLELLSPATTTMWKLEEAGLIENVEKCWSVSLNDLRVVIDILDTPSLFLHYLIRRLDLNEIRKVQARDELDYLMHYIERGLFFREQNQPKDREEITLSGFTGNLNQYYRRVEGSSRVGKKPKPRLGSRTKQILTSLEKRRPKHYISACLEILEFDIPAREELFSKLSRHLSTLRECEETNFSFSFVGNHPSRTALAIATVRGPEFQINLIRARAIQHCKEHGFESMCVILQRIPIGTGAMHVILVGMNSSPGENAIRLLNMLRFKKF